MRIIRRAQNVKFQSLSQSRNPPDQRAAQQSPGVCYPFALKHGRSLLPCTPSNSALAIRPSPCFATCTSGKAQTRQSMRGS